MTIKVIGEDSREIKTTTCRNCAAVLEYTKADTKTEERTDYTGDTDTCRILTCPRCNEYITVAIY